MSVGNQIIETTDNHPFWVDGKEWVIAVDLKVGDKLVQSNGNYLKIDNIEIIHHDKKVEVYNFTVADFHTYFVSDLGIWVHNIGLCGFAAGKAIEGSTTSAGFVLTKHAAENANKRGFSSDLIDTTIGSYSQKFYSYGEEIFARKNGNYYDLIVKDRNSNNIVSVIGGSTNSLKTTKDIEKFFKKQHGMNITTIPMN